MENTPTRKQTLAGTEQTRPSSIIQILKRANESNIEFKRVAREEPEQYLRSLIEHEDWGKADAHQSEKLLKKHDDRYQYAPSLPIMIDLLLDECDVATSTIH